MKKVILHMAIIAAATTAATNGFAQEKTVSTPLFITPYTASVPTYNSRVPSVVSAKGQSQLSRATRTYTKANRVSKPMYDTSVNQFPADFGRITGEQDFYDATTGRYHSQYEYFALLAERGDTARLQEVVTEVQRKGVFDPEKYKQAMGGSTSGKDSGTPKKNVKRVQQVTQKNQVITRQNQLVVPHRVHQGYDEDMRDDEAEVTLPKPRKNAPIFLR